MKGNGSVISFLVKGGNAETRRFIDALELSSSRQVSAAAKAS